MTRHPLDVQERKLVALLAEDGLAPLGRLAQQTKVTAPTVRSRLKGLMACGVLKVVGLIDPFKARGVTVAMVFVTLQDHKDLDTKLAQISSLENVHWAAVVTGRYDIMVEVILSDEIGDLYRFLNEDLSRVGGIRSSESFVVMKARNKWVNIPEGMRQRFAERSI